jgi:hypothetical protein
MFIALWYILRLFFPIAETIKCRMVGWWVDDKLERLWKVAVLA